MPKCFEAHNSTLRTIYRAKSTPCSLSSCPHTRQIVTKCTLWHQWFQCWRNTFWRTILIYFYRLVLKLYDDIYCYVEVSTNVWFYQLRCWDNLAIIKKYSRADVSGVSPLSQRIKELWVVCGLYSQQRTHAIGWKHGNIKKKYDEWKAFFDSMGIWSDNYI